MVVYCEYIYRKYPQIFNSEAIKLMIKNHHEKKAEEREKKKEESLVNRKNKLKKYLTKQTYLIDFITFKEKTNFLNHLEQLTT